MKQEDLDLSKWEITTTNSTDSNIISTLDYNGTWVTYETNIFRLINKIESKIVDSLELEGYTDKIKELIMARKYLKNLNDEY